MAPEIENPACEKLGCKPWEHPQIYNDDYQGPWHAPEIENPDYKGEWAPKQIPNPSFFEDNNPAQSLLPVTAVGFELWTLSKNVEFDNIILDESLATVSAFIDKTFLPKKEFEDDIMYAQSASEGGSIVDQTKDWILELLETEPYKFLGLFAAFIASVTALFMLICSGGAEDNNASEPAIQEASTTGDKKDASKEDEEEADEGQEEEADEEDGEEEEEDKGKPKRRPTRSRKAE
jgi:calnexin